MDADGFFLIVTQRISPCFKVLYNTLEGIVEGYVTEVVMRKPKKKVRANQQKKRLAKAVKRKAKIKHDQHLRRQTAQRKKIEKADPQLLAQLEAFRADDENGFGFWACHGMNFINSNYEEGVWDPVFEQIYDGGLPDPADVEVYVYQHIDPEHPKFTRVGRTLMGYWFSGVAGIYGVAKKAEAVADLAGEDPREPACGSVWKLFNDLLGEMDNQLGNKHLIETTP